MSYTDAEVNAMELGYEVGQLQARIAVLEHELAEARSQRDELNHAIREMLMVGTVALDLRDEPEAEPEPEPPPTPSEAGAFACKAGFPLDANPFPKEFPTHGQWRAGWIGEARGGRR